MVAVAVSLALAVGWLAVGGVLYWWFYDSRLFVPGTWVVTLMCLFNLVKAWAQYRTHKRRGVSRGATQRRYRDGEPPPVRRST